VSALSREQYNPAGMNQQESNDVLASLHIIDGFLRSVRSQRCLPREIDDSHNEVYFTGAKHAIGSFYWKVKNLLCCERSASGHPYTRSNR
jgi:hypothetical protein